MTDKTYADGLVEGRLDRHEETLHVHNGRLNSHSSRFGAMDTRINKFEKLLYAAGAILIMVQTLAAFPGIMELFKK